MNRLVKKGAALKENDLVLRYVNPSGNPSEQTHSWKVSNIKYATALEASDLWLGEEYEIYDTKKKRLFTYSLEGVRLGKDSFYEFEPLDILKAKPFKASASKLPSIHPKGTKHHDGQESITFDFVLRDADGAYTTEEIPFVDIATETFIVDVGNCHVVSCIGKGLEAIRKPILRLLLQSLMVFAACLG
jgi:hypothetical protein